MFLTYQLVTLTGISYEQLKFTVTYAKLKSLGDKRHRQICHASSAEYREKKKLTDYRIPWHHNNYRKIEFCHSKFSISHE